MREVLTGKRLPPPKFRYSPCIKVGPFYHFSGMIAIDLESGQMIEGGVEEQTRKILANLCGALEDLDLTLDHLVSASVFTTKFEEFPMVNKAWEEVFTPEVTPPARSAIGVAALPLGALVEIEFRAYKD